MKEKKKKRFFGQSAFSNNRYKTALAITTPVANIQDQKYLYLLDLISMRGEASRPGKRPARNLSASEKLEIIARVHNGESKASVARNIGVPESTLRGWCKTEHKLRNMARNSSATPDSEANSSSGSNPQQPGPSHLSSDEEIDAAPASAPSAAKKQRLIDMEECLGLADRHRQQVRETNVGLNGLGYEYASQFLSAMMASGVRGTDSMMLLQQMGLLASKGVPGMSRLMGMPALQALTAGAAASSSSSTTSQSVGLVENGLQYSKSSAGSSKHSAANSGKGSSLVTIPPSSRSGDDLGDRSAPTDPPATQSSRKTSDPGVSNGAIPKHYGSPRSSSKKENGTNPGSQEEVLRWLKEHHPMNEATKASAKAPAADELSQSPKSFFSWYQKDVMSSSGSRASYSPSKTKALLDNMLGNTENINSNLPTPSENGQGPKVKKRISSEEAVQYGEMFFDYLSTCSDPMVTRVHIMQLEHILANLKLSQQCRSSRSKHSRK